MSNHYSSTIRGPTNREAIFEHIPVPVDTGKQLISDSEPLRN